MYFDCQFWLRSGVDAVLFRFISINLIWVNWGLVVQPIISTDAREVCAVLKVAFINSACQLFVISYSTIAWWVCRNSIVLPRPSCEADLLHNHCRFVSRCFQTFEKFLLAFVIQFKPFRSLLDAFIPWFLFNYFTIIFKLIHILKHISFIPQLLLEHFTQLDNHFLTRILLWR